MKKIRFLSLILLLTLFFTLAAPAASALDAPEVEGSYCVLLETNTDTVLFEKGAYERAYPASLTKMMTVLLAIEAVEEQRTLPNGQAAALSNQVTANAGFDFDLIAEGSTENIMLGETMSLEDLLYCAMLSSANEACNIVGEYIGGSVGQFVEMMNQRAAELGCTGTHFANTHGLPNENHYTTAWDLSLIAREAVQHTFFRELCNTRSKGLNPTNMSSGRVLSNTNALLNSNEHYPGNYLYEGASGIKTGFTGAAGYCLAALATRDGVNNIQLLSIVLHAPAYDDNADGIIDRYCNFTDSARLFDWGFDNWSYREVIKSTDIITEVPVTMGDGTDTVSVRPSSSIVRLLPNDEDLSTYQKVPVIYAQEDGRELEAPISAGQVLGEISVVKDGRTVGSSSLVASTDVNLSRVLYMRTEISNTLHRPLVRWTFWLLVLLFLFYIFVVVRYRNRRRAYLARVNHARVAQEIADGDADVREWYNDGEGERPAPRGGTSARKKHPVRKSGKSARSAAASRPAAGKNPAKRPSARPGPSDPASPTANDDDKFRDYFEEFFGNKDGKKDDNTDK